VPFNYRFLGQKYVAETGRLESEPLVIDIRCWETARVGLCVSTCTISEYDLFCDAKCLRHPLEFAALEVEWFLLSRKNKLDCVVDVRLALQLKADSGKTGNLMY
jgi:hypothetical protein